MSATQAISLAFLTKEGAFRFRPCMTGEFIRVAPKLKSEFSKGAGGEQPDAPFENRLRLSRLRVHHRCVGCEGPILGSGVGAVRLCQRESTQSMHDFMRAFLSS